MLDISPAEWTAILLSLRVAAVATLVATPLGVALAWLLARRDFWGKSLVDALVHLPLVLPPVVTGYLLLLTFGRRGLVGAWLADHLGIVFGFAKAIGEFGATITFVSNIPGETQTISSAIYSLIQTPDGDIAALRLVAISVVIAVAALIGSEWFARRATQRLHGN